MTTAIAYRQNGCPNERMSQRNEKKQEAIAWQTFQCLAHSRIQCPEPNEKLITRPEGTFKDVPHPRSSLVGIVVSFGISIE